MEQEKFLEILGQAGRLKTNTRHCYTSPDRKESVADHSWRISLMAMLLSHESEFAGLDMNRVIRMCLIHDLGESFTGDIPTFLKTEDDAASEDDIFIRWVQGFPEPERTEWMGLLEEMIALRTPEAQLYKALDKLEALISHDESDIGTWLPLEYDLQLTYGQENMRFSPYLTRLRQLIDDWTRDKIRREAPEHV
ncbi:MAG: HD domain-containing protein [Firmicutes bacterium]|nr:HD domain-containing protein [Bacillota bacterium]